MSPSRAAGRERPVAVIDGLPAESTLARLGRRVQRLLVSQPEREEAALEGLLARPPVLTRPNLVAVGGPNGQVGKTTLTFCAGGMLADRLRLRVIAVDLDPEFGTLGALVPERLRSTRSTVDLLADLDQVTTATDIRPYAATHPSGLHVLRGPESHAERGGLGPENYRELLSLLLTFYDLVMLDLGAGITGVLPQFAIAAADQVLLITKPEALTSTSALAALDHLRELGLIRESDGDAPSDDIEQAALPAPITVAANLFYTRRAADLQQLERQLQEERRMRQAVVVPYDEELAMKLVTGTYELETLARPTRMGIKRLGVAIAEHLG